MGGVCGIGSIKGRLSPIGSLQGALSIPVGGGLDCDIYEGEYNIVPSDTVQVLPTANKLAGIAAGAQANIIEKIKVNGTEVTPAAEDKSIALTIPTGKLAGKDIVAETDLDTALKEKVNAAAEGNHSHANKAFLDTLSGATDEEVTAMCTEVFGA